MASDEDEDDLAQTVSVMDEADVFEGLRAQFPLSFGKQERKQASLEAIHSKTKRDNAAIGASAPHNDKLGSLKDRFMAARQIKASAKKKSEDESSKQSLGPQLPFPRRKMGPLPMPTPGIPEVLSILPVSPSPSHGNDEIGPSLPPKRSPSVTEDEIGPPLPPKQSPSMSKEEIGPPRPMVIGGNAENTDDDEIGPPRPTFVEADGRSTDDEGYTSEDEDGDEDEEEEPYRVPVSNEIVLTGHTKVVSALAVDPTGSRVLTGSYDYSVRMYDFQGMDSRLRSFRQLEPFEGHQVRSLSWSPSADRFFCVTGSAQAKVYDRDGLTLGEFVRGDMYIRDLKNTKGHISGLTGGEWHPKERQTALTSSEDGSLRIWDVEDFKSQKQVIKPKLARPGRVPVTCCAWGLDGKCVAGGLGNGSVQVWNIKAGWGSKPDIYIEKAHEDGEDVSGLRFSADGHTLLSRSFDGTLKVWDMRLTKVPAKVFSGLPNSHGQTNVVYSPDEQLILTGTSVEKDNATGGLLCFFDKKRLELVRKIGISSTQSVVCCAWHPRLNQIFATTGDKKEGGTRILYDPVLSERGALVCVARAPRKKSVEDFEARPVVHHPHALPLFRDEPSRKRQREKARSDPIKSKRPDLPVTGPGFGGRVGTTKGSLLTQYLLKEGGLMKETWMDEDPREAILKHAEAAAKEPKYIAPAYAETQPKTIFATSDSEEDDK